MARTFFVLLSILSIVAAEELRTCVSHSPFRLADASALPGFSTAFGQSGLDYFKVVGLDLLSQKIKNVVVPDVNGVFSKALLGDVVYNVSKINIAGLNFGPSSIKIVEDVGVAVDVENSSATGSLDWHYKQQNFPYIGGTGTANFSISLFVNVRLLFKSVDDHLQLKAVNPTVNVNDIKVHISGQGGSIYQFLIDLLTPLIKTSVGNVLQQQMQTNIQTQINTLLMSVPVRQQIVKPVVFDIGLLRDPQFSKSSFRLFEAGDSYDSEKPTPCPGDVCPQFKLPEDPIKRMAQVYVSEFVANSLGYAAYQAGLIHAEVTPDMVPSSSPIKLNTGALKSVLPPLADAYPDRPVYLEISAVASPSVQFDTTGVSAKQQLTIGISVGVNDTKVLVVSLKGYYAFPVKVALKNAILTGAIGQVTGNWTVTSSTLGDLSAYGPRIAFGINYAGSIGTSIVNGKLSSGISIPTVYGLDFVDPQITFDNHYFSIDMDMKYTPPSI